MSGVSHKPALLQPVAAFDFDGTLLAGNTLLILQRLVRSPWGQLADALVLLPALLCWKSGQHNTDWFKQRVLQQLLSPAMQNRSAEQRIDLLEHGLSDALWRHLRPEALARLEWHRQQGHRLVIVSASPRCLLQAIARRLNVELIATETSDPCSGNPIELLSPNCKGAEKMRRLERWLGEPANFVTELHSYGDSRGDRELLQGAAYPHWRDFSVQSRPYPTNQGLSRWLAIAAVLLMLSALAGLLQLDPATQSSLGSGLRRLPAWLPVILVVLIVSYVGRYLRFRLLLGAEGIGRASFVEAWEWFGGFSLTATPGKLGELSRVQQMHKQLSYPRKPLIHAFIAERLCDAIAVTVWLTLLIPKQLLQRLAPTAASILDVSFLSVFICIGLGATAWHFRSRWQHHFPSRRFALACLPASLVSLGIWGLESMILWMLVQAISPTTAFSAGQAISTYLLSGTAGLASFLPGGLGVNEAATTLLLGQAGIPISIGLSIAVLRRICTIWVIVILSIIAMNSPLKPTPGVKAAVPTLKSRA